MHEVLASQRGEIALPTPIVNAMPAERMKQIRKSVAKSTKEFERSFHIWARTVEGWGQGRRVNAPAGAFLRVIERNPRTVKEARAD